jgi:opacity protein-like surface antigen
MKTNQAIAIVIGLVVVVAAIVIWRISAKPAIQPVPENTATTGSATTSTTAGSSKSSSTKSSATTGSKKTPFSTFITSGGSFFCRINSYNYNTNTKGTVYVDGGRLRANMTLDYQGTKINASVVVKDGYSYVWSGFTPSGFKIATNAPKGNTTLEGKAYSWNADLVGDYDCQIWTSVDSSVFTVPSNIQFQEIK